MTDRKASWVHGAPRGTVFCCATEESAATYRAEFARQGRDDLSAYVPAPHNGISIDWVSYDEYAAIPD